jgi:hypothetical protein
MDNDQYKSESNNNKAKTGLLYGLIGKVFPRILKKGYYGEISFVATIQDGEIQDIKKQEIEKYK